jgi:hypothetical protein
MPATLLNQTIACLQYQWMLMDVPNGRTWPVNVLIGAPNPAVMGAANAAAAIGESVQVNQPADDTALNYLTVAYEAGHFSVTTSPRWVGHGVTGKALDLGAAYGTNTVSGQFFRTPRPRGAYGITRGAGSPGGTVKVELCPY